MLPSSRTRKVNPLYYGADWTSSGRERGADQHNMGPVMKESKPSEVIQLQVQGSQSQAMEWQGLGATLKRKVEGQQQETEITVRNVQEVT